MNTLISQRIVSPLGEIYVCASARGVCLLEFAGTQRILRESSQLERHFGCPITLGENEHTRQTAAELGEHNRRQLLQLISDTHDLIRNGHAGMRARTLHDLETRMEVLRERLGAHER